MPGGVFLSKRVNTATWSEKYKRWQINVQKDGKRRSFYSSTPGRTGQREANRKADAWLEQGSVSDNSTVEQMGEAWLERLKLTTSRSNWRPAESRWRTWVLPNIGSRKLSKLTEQRLQDVVDAAFAGGLSRKTLQSLCADLRSFCKFCRRSGAQILFPEDLHVPAGARAGTKQILQPVDLAQLFSSDMTMWRGKVVEDEYIHAYRFQVLTGLRPGELLGLRWEDLHGRTLYVQRAINQYGEMTRGKNDNAVRSIALSNFALAELQAEGLKSSGPIFEIVGQEHYYRRWKIYCEANGITAVTPYELRHTFVSIAQVLPEGQVKAIVGHSENMDTFGVYGHEFGDQSELAAQQISATFARLLNLK